MAELYRDSRPGFCEWLPSPESKCAASWAGAAGAWWLVDRSGGADDKGENQQHVSPPVQGARGVWQ